MAPLLGGCNLVLFDPKGYVGEQEKTLILESMGVMLLVVIPVIVLTLVFAWRYRASNTNAIYAPKWSHSTAIEVVVWSVPAAIVVFLSFLIWGSTHELDPFKPLESNAAPVHVDVVALNWKWLFIYPDYGIASVNKLVIPTDRPIDFKLTSDSLMNSFYIPQLGSQIYTMAGMQTQLHLIADTAGTYAGQSSNFSGPGFSDMRFETVATTSTAFDDWIQQAKASSLSLNRETYRSLAKDSIKDPVSVFANVTPGLFVDVVGQYMPGMKTDTPSQEQMTMIPAKTQVTE